MKLAILGTGMIVKDMLSAFDSFGVERAWILGTEVCREETEGLVARYGLAGSYYDYDEILASPEIDTVYVALPNALHYEFSRRALEAGKNVICEKPFASNLRESQELAKLAQERGLVLVEAMTVRYMPAVRALKAELAHIGAPKLVVANGSKLSSRYAAFQRGETLPAFDPKMSGGALMDMGVYGLHLIVHLFGRPEAVRYEANVERGIDTSGILTLDYGGFKAVSVAAKDSSAPSYLAIQGSEASVFAASPVNALGSFELMRPGEKPERCEFNEGRHRMHYEFTEFVRAIDAHDADALRPALEESLIVSEIVTEARRQVKAGCDRPMAVRVVRESDGLALFQWMSDDKTERHLGFMEGKREACAGCGHSSLWAELAQARRDGAPGITAGAFPIRVGEEQVATICASGSRLGLDHELCVRALAEALGLPYGGGGADGRVPAFRAVAA